MVGRAKKILLLHVPYGKLYGGVDIRRLGFGIPPLGLAALSAYIRREEGCAVRLIDMLYHGVSMKDLSAILVDFRPDIVGLSSSTPQVENAYAISRMIKCRFPAVQVALGGPHASALPQETLREEPSIDYTVAGEGERPFLALIRGEAPDSIKGLAWRRDGDIVVNARADLIEDLGSLPFPDYASLPIERYGTLYTGPSVGITGARGCPYRCSFCASAVTHLGRYRARPVPVFLDDIEQLLRLGVLRFDIWDDTFTSSPERVYEFTEGYLKKGLKAAWTCETRPDCLDKGMLRQMRRAGLDVLHIGCESGDQDVLDRSAKGITLEQVRQACGWCREEGIATYVYFILGLPYDTVESVRRTISFARGLPIDFAQFSKLVPLPGTAVWRLAEEGRVLRNVARGWQDYDRYGSAIVDSDALPAQELSRLHKHALRSFYGRPSYIWKALKRMNSPSKISACVKMAAAYLS